MVGIPGKSQGCVTCRRRKVKCDAQKPKCQRCLASKRDCEGYEKFPVFLNTTQSGRLKRKALEETKPTRTVDAGSSRQAEADPKTIAPRSNAIVACSRDEEPVKSAVALSTSTALGTQNSQRNVEDVGIYAQFLETFLSASSQPTSQRRPMWILQATEHMRPGEALERSLQAVSWNRAGWQLQDPSLRRRAEILYGDALRKVQASLWYPRKALTNETLATCRALALYEIFESTSNDMSAWNQHTSGVNRLIQLRGPRSYDSPFAAALYRESRVTAMIQAIQFRRPSFLGDPEWTAQGLVQDSDEVSEHRLCDIGLAIAALLSSIDKAQATNDNEGKVEAISSILRDCENIQNDLSRWQSAFTDHYSQSIYELVDSSGTIVVEPDETCDPWPSDVHLQFRDVQHAILTCRYWALEMILSASLFGMASTMPPSSVAQGLVVQNPMDKAIHLATKITRTTPWMLAAGRGLYAAQSMVFPLRGASFVLMSFKHPEAENCRRLYRRLVEEKGLGYAGEVGKRSGGYRLPNGSADTTVIQ